MNRLDNNTILELVFNLRKPARYIGSELNQIVKENPLIRMAICYPDLYEVGMSNNGIRILYDIVNNLPDIACERVFAVPNDFEQKIKKLNLPLYTLETYTPLHELDLIGFNVAYELLYTNVLQILDLGQIPLFSKDRKENHPIIIAGGESVSNPAPINSFFDAFFIGDGEDGIVDILEVIKTSKIESLNRNDSIDLLSNIKNIYIPSKHKFNYNKKNNELIKIDGPVIKKRNLKSYKLHNPEKPLIPNLTIAQERIVVEVTRGCKNFCNYCHAGYYELPYRYSKPEEIKNKILKIMENVYYNSLTLSSLSISDYNNLTPLLNLIMPLLIEKGISISLPSLKVDLNTLPIIETISGLRKSSLTFAVESGCDEIRNIANKKLKTDDILSIAEHVFNKGWKLIKLYFMIGLPGCEKQDEAEAIIELLKKLSKIGGKKRALNVTLSPFVPKPHTPFQWEKQMSVKYLSDSINKIKRSLPRSISIKAHDVKASLLEGALSRGDIFLNDVIYESYMNGCRLDSWKEHFNFEIWENNLNRITPGWEKYLSEKNENDILPWEFISTGFEGFVKSQKKKSNCPDKQIPKKLSTTHREELNIQTFKESYNLFEKKYDVLKRIRIKLEKTGKAKFISHLDFIEIIKRALRVNNIPVSFTQGFNKRERLSMGFPLPIGIESICEISDIDLYSDIDITTITDALNPKLPEEINVINAVYLDKKEAIMSITSAAEFIITIYDKPLIDNCVKSLKSKMDFIKETKKGQKLLSFSDVVFDYSIEDQTIEDQKGNKKEIKNRTPAIKIKISVGSEKSMRIDNIILALAETIYDNFYKFKIVKVGQYKQVDNKLFLI